MAGLIARQLLLLAGCCVAGVRAVQWPADWPDIKAAPPSRPPGGPQVSNVMLGADSRRAPADALPVLAGAVLHEGQQGE
jgi:hypothetical protein